MATRKATQNRGDWPIFRCAKTDPESERARRGAKRRAGANIALDRPFTSGPIVQVVQLAHSVGMTHSPKNQRIPIMMSAEELAQLEDWRFSHRIWSRGEAIRQLLVRGMQPDTQRLCDKPAMEASLPTSSGAALIALPDDLLDLIEAYRSNRPYLSTLGDTLVELVREGLTTEFREDLLTIPDDILADLKELASRRTLEQTAHRLLRDAIHACQARREAQDE